MCDREDNNCKKTMERKKLRMVMIKRWKFSREKQKPLMLIIDTRKTNKMRTRKTKIDLFFVDYN